MKQVAANDWHSEAAKFFDEFVFAFARFDGAVIAARYTAPYLAVHADGTTALYSSRAEIGEYFQTVVTAYHRQGCRSCRYKHLHVVALGERSSLATVTWELLTETAGVLAAWRESYTLLRTADGLRVCASVDHAGPLSD